MLQATQNNQAALAQYYRWYQLYERDMFYPKRPANQLEILDEDVIIKSAAGKMKGRAGYLEERVTRIKKADLVQLEPFAIY
jgi:hypothetical protein